MGKTPGFHVFFPRELTPAGYYFCSSSPADLFQNKLNPALLICMELMIG
jgi:hypothetical protein